MVVDQSNIRGRLAQMTRAAGAIAVAALISFGGMAAAEAKDPVVFAAASLKNALDAINAQWKAETAKQATVSYAASSALAKQIESGAPADIFISADLDWMDYLAKKDLIKPDSRVTLLGNRIVLIAPKDSPVKIDIGPGFDLAKALGDGRLAMGDTSAVPAGKYGKAALEKLGAWAGVENKIAQAESVRAALLLVSRGEAPLGIVYATDAAADPQVKIVGTFPENSHPPILYPIALTKDSSHPDAAAFLAYLQSGKARPLFEKEGFTVLSKPVTQ
ncbi:molybdate ABC transporter periplasmic binding protein [Chelatococcus asaccharovorans]|nr:molybdate ABC transporter periplasmic binding protein [Chelatococcus asaccharovorans]CAH1676887.1 molybdate ABC transporter periplasmic binding protein [Chelatococcus asaccharovorans]